MAQALLETEKEMFSLWMSYIWLFLADLCRRPANGRESETVFCMRPLCSVPHTGGCYVFENKKLGHKNEIILYIYYFFYREFKTSHIVHKCEMLSAVFHINRF